MTQQAMVDTLRAMLADGRLFVRVARDAGLLVGIKVDQGAKPLAAQPGEKVTEGLEGLRERLQAHARLGARFAKWRAVIAIGDVQLPSPACIDINAHALGRDAALCQEAGLVPVVEAEVLMDGGHSRKRCQAVTEDLPGSVLRQLERQGVALEATILKCNMVLAGRSCAVQDTVDEVANSTLQCLRRVVPAAVPGIMFLSGGQSPSWPAAGSTPCNAGIQAPGPCRYRSPVRSSSLPRALGPASPPTARPPRRC